MWSDGSSNNVETHNGFGCPYLNQTGADAVRDWANILAAIDWLALPLNLQVELQQLQGSPASIGPAQISAAGAPAI